MNGGARRYSHPQRPVIPAKERHPRENGDGNPESARKPALAGSHPHPSLLPSREKEYVGWDSRLLSVNIPLQAHQERRDMSVAIRAWFGLNAVREAAFALIGSVSHCSLLSLLSENRAYANFSPTPKVAHPPAKGVTLGSRTRRVGVWRSGSAPVLGTGGRRFDPAHPDQTSLIPRHSHHPPASSPSPAYETQRLVEAPV